MQMPLPKVRAEGKGETYANAFAKAIANGKGETYAKACANAFAKVRAEGKGETYAMAYAKAIADGKTKTYAHNYGNTAVAREQQEERERKWREEREERERKWREEREEREATNRVMAALIQKARESSYYRPAYVQIRDQGVVTTMQILMRYTMLSGDRRGKVTLMRQPWPIDMPIKLLAGDGKNSSLAHETTMATQ